MPEISKRMSICASKPKATQWSYAWRYRAIKTACQLAKHWQHCLKDAKMECDSQAGAAVPAKGGGADCQRDSKRIHSQTDCNEKLGKKVYKRIV